MNSMYNVSRGTAMNCMHNVSRCTGMNCMCNVSRGTADELHVLCIQRYRYKLYVSRSTVKNSMYQEVG